MTDITLRALGKYETDADWFAGALEGYYRALNIQAEMIEASPLPPWVGLISQWDRYLQYLVWDQSRPGYPEGAD